MKTRESAENYLEVILLLTAKKSAVRSIDIVNEMEFSKPSISVAMKNLKSAGHIEIDDDGFITLTESGRAIAESVYERHTIISSWLISIGVEPLTAREDACRIEHILSPESFAAIKKFIKGK